MGKKGKGESDKWGKGEKGKSEKETRKVKGDKGIRVEGIMG